MRRGTLALLLLFAGAALACGPRYARVVAHEADGVSVTLRAQKDGSGHVERGFSHPTTISGVRLAHILAALEVRVAAKDDKPRRGAIPVELIYPVGAALSAALAKADSSQEVVVQALRVERSLGFFTSKYLTSLVSWVEGDELIVHLGHVDWPLPKSADEKIPEPWVHKASKRFKVMPGEGIVPRSAQAVAVQWRDPRFRKASHVRLTPTGRAQRRTILMDTPSEELPSEAPAPALPPDLTPELLRELADLEEARRAGQIHEAEYSARRRAILEGATPSATPATGDDASPASGDVAAPPP